MSDAPGLVKLLLDENLSPWAAEQLRTGGIDAVHIRERGVLSALDHQVARLAYDEDRVLVTSNVADFERLYRATELNAGLVLITTGNLLRAEQLRLLQQIVDLLGAEPDMINRVLEIDADGSYVFRDLPQ